MRRNLRDAIVYVQKTVELYPDNNRSYLELSGTYSRKEVYDTALVIFDIWYSMYKEDMLHRWQYNVFYNKFKYALIKSGKDPEKGYQKIILNSFFHSYPVLKLLSYVYFFNYFVLAYFISIYNRLKSWPTIQVPVEIFWKRSQQQP